MAFLVISVASQKRRHFSADFKRDETDKNNPDPSQENMGDAPELLHRSLLRNP